jgi:hypothetical protein
LFFSIRFQSQQFPYRERLAVGGAKQVLDPEFMAGEKSFQGERFQLHDCHPKSSQFPCQEIGKGERTLAARKQNRLSRWPLCAGVKTEWEK